VNIDSEDLDEGQNVWPAFVDLLAALALLFATLVIVFIVLGHRRIEQVERDNAARKTMIDFLTRALEGTQAAKDSVYTVEQDGRFVRLVIREQATFQQGEYQWSSLREEGKLALKEIGITLGDPTLSELVREVRIIGHSDSVPYYVPGFSNWELSASRAAVVARYLVTYINVDPCKISATGVGPYYPRSDHGPELRSSERNRRNRRIEIEIIPASAVVAEHQERPGCNPIGDGSRR
jgi:chemotaxis protein MotB